MFVATIRGWTAVRPNAWSSAGSRGRFARRADRPPPPGLRAALGGGAQLHGDLPGRGDDATALLRRRLLRRRAGRPARRHRGAPRPASQNTCSALQAPRGLSLGQFAVEPAIKGRGVGSRASRAARGRGASPARHRTRVRHRRTGRAPRLLLHLARLSTRRPDPLGRQDLRQRPALEAAPAGATRGLAGGWTAYRRRGRRGDRHSAGSDSGPKPRYPGPPAPFCGARVRLRVKDIDFERKEILIRDGKGAKDRVTMLPVTLADLLQRHLQTVKALHDADLQAGYGSVYLPNALERKYPNASREWGWQYVFPATQVSVDPRSGISRRHHLDEKGLQRAMKQAVRDSGLVKPATPHTLTPFLCHAFA